MPGRIAWITVAPVKGMALEQRHEVELEPFGVIENRRFHVIGDGGRLLNGKQLGELQPDRREMERGRFDARVLLPRRNRRRGHGRAGRARDDQLLRPRDVEGRLVVGPWSEAMSSFVGRALRLVQCVEAGAGSRPRPRGRVDPLHRIARGHARRGRDLRAGRPAPLPDAFRRRGDRPARGGRVDRAQRPRRRGGRGSRRQRRPLHRHQPPPGDRRAEPADARRPRRVPPRRRDDRAAAVRRLGQRWWSRAGSRSATRSNPTSRPCIPSSSRSSRTSTTPTPASRRCGGRSSAPARPGIGEIEALVLEAWAAKRLVTFEDAERGLCFGRLDLDGVLRPLYVGRRWVHEEQTPIVVNWQAPAARRLLHRDRRRAAGRRRSAADSAPRADGCSTSTTSRSTAPPGTSSTASPTSCSRSSSAAATSTCATSSRRSRPTSTA